MRLNERHWGLAAFVTTWALLLISCVLLWFGVILPTFPSVSGGYDKMNKHLDTIYAVFMHGFSIPGICALLVGASTFLISKRQPPVLPGATRGSIRRMSCSSHLLAASAATAGLILVGWVVYGPARLGSAIQDPEIQRAALALARTTLEPRKEDRNPSPWHQLTLGMARISQRTFCRGRSHPQRRPGPRARE